MCSRVKITQSPQQLLSVHCHAQICQSTPSSGQPQLPGDAPLERWALSCRLRLSVPSVAGLHHARQLRGRTLCPNLRQSFLTHQSWCNICCWDQPMRQRTIVVSARMICGLGHEQRLCRTQQIFLSSVRRGNVRSREGRRVENY